MQIVIDNLLTNYTTWGKKGEYILCIHGWADASSTFERIAKYLDGSYRLVSLDLPGFGNTEKPKNDWTIQEYTIFVEHFLKKININPDVVIGHSNGGAIAIHGLAGGHFRMKRAVLLASSGIRNQDKGRRAILSIVAKLIKLLLRVLPSDLQKRLKGKAYKLIGSDFYVAEHMQGTFKNIVSYDIRDEASRVSVPTLLIYGDRDKSTPTSYGRILQASLQDSSFITIGGAGHFLHQEEPERIVTEIRKFIA